MPIFDQGYQHWNGPLSGHGWRWLAIAKHGVRVQLKNRILRLLVLFAWLPALSLVGVVALWGLIEQKNETILGLVGGMLSPDMLRDPLAYRAPVWTVVYSFFFQAQIYCIMLLVVIAGPGLISRDLRFNALPLYFSRPLTRFDYFLGKLGVIGALVASVAVGPAVFAYAVGVCFSLDLTVVKDTLGVLAGSVAYGLVITLSAGTLMLALSSMSSRSLYVGIAFAGLWVISGSVATIMTGIHRESVMRGIMQDHVSSWLANHPPPAGVQMNGPWVIGMQDRHSPEVDRWMQEYHGAWQVARMQSQLRQGEAAHDDWRPLCSYVGNLGRMADFFLDTDTAWVTFGKAALKRRQGPGGPGMRGGGPEPPPGSERFLADIMVAQYPWWWSAAVLTGRLGLSTWIMTRRVKSLDRLK
jgi:ABC-2 type transport system permease protein